MFHQIKRHLSNSKTSYFEHQLFALKAGFKLIYAGFASLIHAIIPSFFPSTSAKIVNDLYKKRLENHPNLEYRKMIDD